ncbi:GntR family transcriptional regulator [Sporichthya polymorpha]|uniref:GntR family transcriptional regulator n=1 Tax=Sporichthya polymorpha TaxID=35751 RepID=UPI0003613CBE|nr:GntR family transcriptional regulator [Sporichthya polymorpha]
MAAIEPAPPQRTTTVERAISEIRALLRSRQLVPGQQVRQEALAGRLGVSRIPVREALKALAAEGILDHEPNVGYTVARLNAAELAQIYLMRRALETEVLRALPRLTSTQVKELTALNDAIGEAVERADVAEILATNQAFHFAMFGLSGLDLVVAEIEKLWRRSEPYRTLHLYDSDGRKRIVREHRRMITALRQGDHEQVVALMDAHRDLTVSDLHTALAPSPR